MNITQEFEDMYSGESDSTGDWDESFVRKKKEEPKTKED